MIRNIFGIYPISENVRRWPITCPHSPNEFTLSELLGVGETPNNSSPTG